MYSPQYSDMYIIYYLQKKSIVYILSVNKNVLNSYQIQFGAVLFTALYCCIICF
jgi:hypothetical protein